MSRFRWLSYNIPYNSCFMHRSTKIKWGWAWDCSCSRGMWSDFESIPRCTPDGSSARTRVRVCNCCLLKIPWGRSSRYCWRLDNPSWHRRKVFADWWSCCVTILINFGWLRGGFRSWVYRFVDRRRLVWLATEKGWRGCWRRWRWSCYTRRRYWSWGPFPRGGTFRIIYTGTEWSRTEWWASSESSPGSPCTSGMRRWCTLVRWRRWRPRRGWSGFVPVCFNSSWRRSGWVGEVRWVIVLCGRCAIRSLGVIDGRSY